MILPDVTNLRILFIAFSEWLELQSCAMRLQCIHPMPETRAQRIVATWHDKGLNVKQAVQGFTTAGSYRTAEGSVNDNQR